MSPLRVLLIDDEKPIQTLISVSLEDEDFKVSCVSNAEEGMKRIAELKADFVLLDVGLPGISGLEALKKIRQFSQVPILMLTVESDDATKVDALESGADDYIVKPFSLPELRARIRAILRRKSENLTNKPSVKSFTKDQLEVDFEKRIVTVSGAETHLTDTEYRLLSLFIENSDRALTHNFVLKKIWLNTSSEGQLHYLRVYINNLRKKIELDPTNPKLIVTEPGVGYRFKA